jgi:hypothetical protein
MLQLGAARKNQPTYQPNAPIGSSKKKPTNLPTKCSNWEQQEKTKPNRQLMNGKLE